MELSVIITHYKTPHLLVRSIESLMSFLKGIEYEIVVSDSEAVPATRQLLGETFAKRKILYFGFKENVGYGYLVNQGLKRVKGRYILIMNADVSPKDSHALSFLLSYIKKHPNVGLIGGKLVNTDGRTHQSYFREPTIGAIMARRTWWGKTPWGKGALDRYEYRDYNGDYPLHVDWLMGSCLFTTREAVSRVGLLDEQFFMYLEDVDWARRFRIKGYEVMYHPEASFVNYQKGASARKQGVSEFFFNPYVRVHAVSLLKYWWKWKGNHAI